MNTNFQGPAWDFQTAKSMQVKRVCAHIHVHLWQFANATGSMAEILSAGTTLRVQ